MIAKLINTFVLSLTLLSCNGQNKDSISYEMVQPIRINRFDKELFRLIETHDVQLQSELVTSYPQMMDVFGKAVLNLKQVEVPGYFDKLLKYYSEPTLQGLYRDAIVQFSSVEKIEKDLGYGFAYLTQHFPSMQIPAVYMHVSGLNQNVLVGDSLLSLSIDKYMGETYALYKDFFYEFQKRKMCPDLVVPDYLVGWIMAEFPFEGKENILLDRLIYEGKIKYLLSQSLRDVDEAKLMGYTAKDLVWCKENEGEVWKAIIERKHLYTPDLQTTSKYFEAAPLLFPEAEAPGSLGIWIGWQIVNQYMKETGVSVETLMRNNDAQSILTASKYKPMK